jgi:hypothetical protein
MTPIQGDWTISSIHLPNSVLRKIYFDNARKLLARSLPSPVLEARRISQDFQLDGCLTSPLWQTARPAIVDQNSSDGSAIPAMSTTVRALWSDKYLYLAYECPFTTLTVFPPEKNSGKRFALDKSGASLWDRDVVEAFIGTDADNVRHYAEFEIAPTNERLDLMVTNLPDKDFNWNSQFESKVQIDKKTKVWTCEVRVPMESLSSVQPSVGTRWRLNLYRCDRANHASLAFRPTLNGSFHTPERFGVLSLIE